MDFPRFVFRCPGQLACNGGTYDQELVNNQAEYDAAIKAGYYPDLGKALKAEEKASEAEEKKAKFSKPNTEGKA